MDHPLEHALFLTEPGKLVDNLLDDPLATGAHGLPSFYRAYAKSLMRTEKSGIGIAAAINLAVAYGALSAEVHPAIGAVHPSGTLALAADHYDRKVAARIREDVNGVFSNSIALVVACEPSLLSKLDAIDREWFDWLMGADWAKIIRGQEFGVMRPG
ncbi:MAG: hypothetical protein ABSE59_06925 [Opitutaceae bacterium]